MKMVETFDVSEQVMIPAKVVKREFDDRGNIKYKLKDIKTGKIFDWFYGQKDIFPCEESQKIKTKKTTTNKIN